LVIPGSKLPGHFPEIPENFGSFGILSAKLLECSRNFRTMNEMPWHFPEFPEKCPGISRNFLKKNSRPFPDIYEKRPGVS
jgi:hypothetical protein